MSTLLIPLIVTMTTIAMAIYILRKETNLLGKRYNKEYETHMDIRQYWRKYPCHH